MVLPCSSPEIPEHAARAIRRRGWPCRGLLVGLVLLATSGLGAPRLGHTGRPVVYVVPIAGVIDLGLAPFVDRVLEVAAGADATAVILEINTFGGRVDAAVLIRDALLRARVRTVAFVNKRAISAGALIALAAETIAMADGGTIGAATPVEMGLPGAPAQPVAEKTVSYMRKEFRATAESRKRPPVLAEAMVDADVEIPEVIAKGKLLTLTTEEALQHQLADVRADSLAALLQSLDLTGADVRMASQTWAETLVRFLTHPVVSSLLMTLGMLGLIVELRTPGFGVPGALGLTSLGLFFWGHWLVRLAGWEELLLVGLWPRAPRPRGVHHPGFWSAGDAGARGPAGRPRPERRGCGRHVGGDPHGHGVGGPRCVAGPRRLPGPAACPAAPALGPPPGPGDRALGRCGRCLSACARPALVGQGRDRSDPATTGGRRAPGWRACGCGVGGRIY